MYPALSLKAKQTGTILFLSILTPVSIDVANNTLVTFSGSVSVTFALTNVYPSMLLFYSLVNDITSQTLSDFGSILKESQLSVSKKNMLCIYATDCVTHVIFDVFAEELLVTIIARSHSLDIFELLTLAKVKMYVLNGCNINFCGLEPT